MSVVSIRSVAASDAAIIRHLNITSFSETFAAVNKPADMEQYFREELNEEKISAAIADVRNTFFIAAVDGVPAGFAKVRDTHTPEELNGIRALEIERLYVLACFHGQKVGAALMQHCLQTAIVGGFPLVWLGVWEHNQKAISFYTRWGFTPFSDHIFRLGTDNQRDILMKRTV